MSGFSERDVLRKQLRNDIIEHLRRERGAPAPGTTFARVATCHVLSRQHGIPAAAVAAQHFPYDADVVKGLAKPGLIFKAASGPAMTTVPAWAGELVGTTVSGALTIISPNSVYSQLAAAPGSIRVSLAGPVKIPSRTPTAPAAPPFVGEGQPIPVRQFALGGATLAPKKAAVISVMTAEMLAHSVPDLEKLIRFILASDVATAIDGVLLGNAAGTPVAPPGLLFGVSATPATAGGGLPAFAGDVRALAAAIELSGAMANPTLIMSTTSAMLLGSQLLGWIDGGPLDLAIVASPTCPTKMLIMVDAANFASGEGDEPSMMASNESIVHMEDTTPLPIGTAGAPAVVAAPTSSMFQVNCIATRLLQDCSWTMSRPARVAFINAVSW
ncbi:MULTISPECIES: phage major capsid protein [Bradyrhizobium]|uniref:phage major capsid family protein n=1 Tax=Bradyrhizobium TaxID=374 RepID=UPI0004B7A063|nr:MULTISPECIES: phage major capsid protein [Bradyrhizobium]MBR1031911.1 phage major capsid protein [Bradyrhizobium liaoningense]MDI2077662.1 phage major capsid protein [Bradyrhizobium sp. Mp27]